MACSFSTEEEFQSLQKESLAFVNTEKTFAMILNNDKITKLKRGGYVVKTAVGPIQFGLPPETVKDSLIGGLEIPTNYVIPTNRFNRKYGLSTAEFEFPAYFNYFVKKRQINLICSKEAEQAIRIVFQETLCGPKSHPDLADEFHYTFDKEGIPNFHKERSYFAKVPGDPTKLVDVDTLIRFTIFDETSGVAYLDEGVTVRKDEGYFTVLENDLEICQVPDEIEINTDDEYKEYDSNTITTKGLMNKDIKEFDPPAFGVTILGCSHGFDPKGSTTGFILWINRRGIMVDPPPFSSMILRKYSIPPSLIESIIISHCHADHDAGVIQKVLETSRVEIITTKTIMESFIRKYSAITQIDDLLMRKLFIFRPVIIGTPMLIHGAQFRFFYALHTIPCIGFGVHYGDRSIYFSADTYYDPEKMIDLRKQGLMTQKRYEMLAGVKLGNYSLILHEAGVPPIHTPISVLASLPSDVKKRLLLVHVAKKDVPSNAELNVALPGIENTISLEAIVPKALPILRKIDLLSGIEVFENLSIRNARDLIQVSTEEHYKKGQIIVKEGTFGNKFYIIERGIVRVYSNSPDSKFERFAVVGDYFGESALLDSKSKRMASVEALTDVSLFVIEKHDFWFVFGENQGMEAPVMKKLLNLSNSRKSKAIQTIIKNPILTELTQSQKTQLEMILKLVEIKEKETLWTAGTEATFVFIVVSGIFKFVLCPEAKLVDEFLTGSFVGEVKALFNDTVLTTTVKAMTDGLIYKIAKDDFLNFLSKNPGLLVSFSENKYII